LVTPQDEAGIEEPDRVTRHHAAEATLQELERHAIADALAKAKGNKTAAAAALSVCRSKTLDVSGRAGAATLVSGYLSIQVV
jgi:transcriptional regulator with PAS, ATPase and Fis domain